MKKVTFNCRADADPLRERLSHMREGDIPFLTVILSVSKLKLKVLRRGSKNQIAVLEKCSGMPGVVCAIIVQEQDEIVARIILGDAIKNETYFDE